MRRLRYHRSVAFDDQNNLSQTELLYYVYPMKQLRVLIAALKLDVEVKDIPELVNYADGELTKEDLIELEALQHLEKKRKEQNKCKRSSRCIGLASVFSNINGSVLEQEDMDPNFERCNKVECGKSKLSKRNL
ncbi:hypothetical protein NPIL_205781 [Nephila pilipes]|uniref:Uncharacterized protein n=1 Tax=Nephila pilipes TaxID=299642 RepID=A0A8X6PIK2_NEPPI|nr:hypothetical protein NPIL_205781 [Nephila pilipes]